MSDGTVGTEIGVEVRTGYNATGSTIVKGTPIKLVAGAAYNQITPAVAITDVVYGVAGNDIPTGSYGPVYIRGRVQVVAGAALTVGGLVSPNASSKVINAAAGSRPFAIAIQVGADTELTEVELIGPGALVAA
jgi:hypothetical protein